MITFKITAEHIDEDCKYIGPDISDYDGNIEIAGNLGDVEVSNIICSGFIHVKTGSSLNARGWIDAGGYIDANDSIKAEKWIKSGNSIKAEKWIVSGNWIRANGYISAGGSIMAGRWIESRSRIEAGKWICAGTDIHAHLSITCKEELRSGGRIFAGVCPWIDVDKEDMRIICGSFEGGVIAFGELIETGHEPSLDGKTAVIDGTEYLLTINQKEKQ